MSVIVDNLCKDFGTQKAVDNLSFSVNSGEILGFLGPNGAGKSTSMKMITGYMQATSGNIRVCGLNPFDSGTESRKKIGYLPENNPLYKDMYIKEYLHFVASIHRLDNKNKKVKDMIDLTGLGIEQNKLIGALSKGYRQRVGLAQALIHDPEVLILDEPTSGLDMNQLIDIRALIKDLGKKKTLIFSTHIMQEVQALCDRVIIINKGKLIADDPIDSLQNRIQGENLVKVEFLKENFDVTKIENMEGVKRVKQMNNKLEIFTDSSKDIREDLFRLSSASGWVIIEMAMEKLSVEYIFQKLTKEEVHV
jgi:ABC-2 type transport system ATP-binding protein